MGRTTTNMIIDTQRLQKLLDDQGITRYRLMKKTGITSRTFYRIANAGEISEINLLKVSSELHVNPYYLTGEDDSPSFEAFEKRKEQEHFVDYVLDRLQAEKDLKHYLTDQEYGYHGFKFDFDQLNERQWSRLENGIFEYVHSFLKEEHLLPEESEEE